MRGKLIIGIDEVGRGPLAGPVVVCALVIPARLSLRGAKFDLATRQSRALPLRDSKQLTELQRLAWSGWIKAHPKIRYAVARVYPRGIDRLNISQAANLAATKACLRLIDRCSMTDVGRISVLLDGGLYLKPLPVEGYVSRVTARTIVRGDEKFTAIKLASIIAKVTRDKFMLKLHKKYPRYGFDKHKGYGTPAHILAIKKFGLSDVHRRSFTKNFV